MSDRRYPVSNHRLRRKAVELLGDLRAAQELVGMEMRAAELQRRPLMIARNSRLGHAFALLQRYGVDPHDKLSVGGARLRWHYHVYRDPA